MTCIVSGEALDATHSLRCLVNDVSYWLRRWDFLKCQNAAVHGIFGTHCICWWCVDVVSMLRSWHIWSVRTRGKNRALLLRIVCSSCEVSSRGRHGPLVPLRYTCTLPCAAVCVDGLRVLLLVCHSRYYVPLRYVDCFIFGQFWAVEISGQFVLVLSIGTADSTLWQNAAKVTWFGF